MYINFNSNTSSILSLPSVSVHSKVVFNNAIEFRCIDEYTSSYAQERIFVALGPYIHKYGPKEYRLRDTYIANKQYRDVIYGIFDVYTYRSNRGITFFKAKDVYHIGRKYKNSKYFIHDTYSIRLSYIKRDISIKDAFNVSNVSMQDVNLIFKDSYMHHKTFERVYKLKDRYSQYLTEVSLYRILDSYRLIDSMMPIKDSSVTIENVSGKTNVLINLKDKDLGISNKDGIRVFVNCPPRYINYCATLDSDKLAAHLKRTRASYTLVIPDVGDVSTLPAISLSIYKYDTAPIDTREKIDNTLYVSNNVYDPSVLHNLNAKRIDIRNESILLTDNKINVYLYSPYMNIRVKPENNCCLSRVVNIGGNSYDICKLPDGTVKLDTYKEDSRINMSFDKYLRGFNRIKSKIEIDSSNIPR